MGRPSAWKARSAPGNSSPISLRSVVLSPPGITRPARPWSSPGFRTSAVATPRRASARAWAAKSPWRARTPMGRPFSALTSLPPAGLEELLLRDLRGLEADHRLAQVLRHLGQHVGVLVVRGGLDDGPGSDRRVGRLEDARADEDRLGPELHHERGVRRRGDAAGREVRHRQVAFAGEPADPLVGRPEALGLA